MITRPVAFAMMERSALPTSASEGVKDDFIEFVESDSSRSTPISLKRASAAKSVWTPSIGVWSSLKSPVCMTLPAGVCMKTPTAPGMEWFTAKKSIRKLPSFISSPAWISHRRAFTRCSANFPSIRPSVSFVA